MFSDEGAHGLNSSMALIALSNEKILDESLMRVITMYVFKPVTKMHNHCA